MESHSNWGEAETSLIQSQSHSLLLLVRAAETCVAKPTGLSHFNTLKAPACVVSCACVYFCARARVCVCGACVCNSLFSVKYLRIAVLCPIGNLPSVISHE